MGWASLILELQAEGGARARAGGLEGVAFLVGGNQALLKAGAGDAAQGQVLRLHTQPALWDSSQSWCWHSEEAPVVGDHTVCLRDRTPQSDQ